PASMEAPHWLYPGGFLNCSEVAVRAGGDTVTAVPQDTSAAAADTVRAAPGDTIAAVVPTDTAMAPVDTIPADTAQLIVEAPPPHLTESNETIFVRRLPNHPAVQDRM